MVVGLVQIAISRSSIGDLTGMILVLGAAGALAAPTSRLRATGFAIAFAALSAAQLAR
jgi:hypothetical protein